MQLTIEDETIEHPTITDLERTIPDARPEPDWYVHLSHDDETFIEAEATPEGSYKVSYAEGGKLREATAAIDPAHLREIFALYLEGDQAWRSRLAWRDFDPATVPASTKPKPWQILLIPLFFVAASIGFPILIGSLGSMPWLHLPLPTWLDSTPSRLILGFFALCVAVFLVALIVKLYETNRAARWPKAMARITRSKSGFALTRTNDTDIPRNERAADIEYEFEVAGKTYRGNRFTLAEITSEDEVPGILARFPEGKIVPVYYNPKNPSEATLDRDVPQGAMLGCLTLLAVGVAAVIAIMYLATNGPHLVRLVFPNAIPVLFFMFGFPAIFLLAIALLIQRNTLAARRWPKTMGTVTRSEVHSFELARNRSRASVNYGSATSTSYMPVVEFDYKVAGKSYTSRSMRLDTEVAGSRDYAQKLADKYPVGRLVPVTYDPADPSRSALEVGNGIVWLLLALSIVLALLTVWSTGLLTDGPPLKMH